MVKTSLSAQMLIHVVLHGWTKMFEEKGRVSGASHYEVH